ncbi:ral guanine nucleotide dissociation stimulator-like [Thomomys bottae]
MPAQLTGEHFFIPTFLSTYRKFTSTEHVLDLLFQTFSRGEAFKDSSTQDEILPFSSQDGMPQDKLRNALSSILDMWLGGLLPACTRCLPQAVAGSPEEAHDWNTRGEPCTTAPGSDAGPRAQPDTA